MDAARVLIILVNYRGSHDTAECLESVFRLIHPRFHVAVIDNASGDASLASLAAWADGEWPAPLGDTAMAAFSQPPIPKPLPYRRLSRAEAEAGGTDDETPLLLIEAGANLGFAGGNNIGMRYALARDDVDYVWLLNNDTVVAPDALTRLLERCAASGEPMSCGNRILYYAQPDTIQALGGGPYNRWTGIAWTTLGRGRAAAQSVDTPAVERRLDYIMGASWLLPRAFLETVGLMREDYFLYCEEIDWCLRARGRFRLGYADDAWVYHKEGGSIGSPSQDRPSSPMSDFYIFRNKLWVTRRFFPWAYPIAYLASLGQALNRLRRGQWAKAWLVLRVLLGKTTYP